MKLAIDGNLHFFWFWLKYTLCSQNHLYFRSTYTKSHASKGTMSRSVAIAAHNRHARLGDSQFRPDYMHNTLVRMI
jgi:hypothetical protein